MKIAACLATTLDGKIDLYNNQKWRFSSDEDMERLRLLRDQYEVSLIGGSTFRQWPILRKGKETIPKQCIVTSNESEIVEALKRFRVKNPDIFLNVFHCGREKTEKFTRYFGINKQSMTKNIVKHLDSFGAYKTLLLEGGGRLIGQFIDDELLTDLYLTIVPKLFGGIKDNSLLVCLKEYTKEKLPTVNVVSSEITSSKEILLHLKINYQAK